MLCGWTICKEMKLTVTLTMLFSAATYALHFTDSEVKSFFNEWKQQYSKFYDTQMEENHRYNIFAENLDLVTSHNKLADEGKCIYYYYIIYYTVFFIILTFHIYIYILILNVFSFFQIRDESTCRLD